MQREFWRLFARRRPSDGASPRTDRQAGFTLIEVLIVLAIIGMVASLVGPRVLGYLSDSKTKAARIQIEAIGSALDLYFLDNGRYPTSSEGIGALVRKPGSAAQWNGPYLKSGDVPKDPWGNPYVYRVPGHGGPYDILSLGPDGREGQQSISNHAP
jgi:general secretion pathway protein G